MGVFDILNTWWSTSSSAFSSIVDLFSIPIGDLIDIDIPIVSQITNLVLSISVGGITLGEVSLFSFLLGSAISLFITVTIIKWFIGIVT